LVVVLRRLTIFNYRLHIPFCHLGPMILSDLGDIVVGGGAADTREGLLDNLDIQGDEEASVGEEA
jgi:hypothetical protein